MKYKTLGDTDLKVSLICLGTMTWGEQNTQKEGFEQMDYAVEKEINFFDTDELYAIRQAQRDDPNFEIRLSQRIGEIMGEPVVFVKKIFKKLEE